MIVLHLTGIGSGGWNHRTQDASEAALNALASEYNFAVEYTDTADGHFTDSKLAQYDVVVCSNTSGDFLSDGERAAFQRYIKGGGGFVGIHAAADAEHEWEWYGRLVGGYFRGHPNSPNIRKTMIYVVNADHPATRAVPSEWEFEDEWYSYDLKNPRIDRLMVLDESYLGSGEQRLKMEPDHPIAWCHEMGDGRAFYTGLGHSSEVFEHAVFRLHLLGGLLYAAGG